MLIPSRVAGLNRRFLRDLQWASASASTHAVLKAVAWSDPELRKLLAALWRDFADPLECLGDQERLLRIWEIQGKAHFKQIMVSPSQLFFFEDRAILIIQNWGTILLIVSLTSRARGWKNRPVLYKWECSNEPVIWGSNK